MPIPFDRFKCVIQGTIANVQTWSTAFWVRGSVNLMTFDIAGVAGLIEDPVQDWCTAFSAWWSSDTKGTALAVYYYPANEDTANQNALAVFSSAIAGHGSGTPLPTFCSLVQTLNTGLSGRSYRGRMYAPLTQIGLGTDGQVSNSLALDAATATANLFEAVNALDLTSVGVTSPKCCVASSTKSAMTPITQVGVDTLVDVQHRREDKIGANSRQIVAVV